MKDVQATLVEIFSSIQGEGPRVGERQTFIRFQGCDLKCQWCDTTESFDPHPYFRVEKIPFSGDWEDHPNPVGAEELSDWAHYFSDPMISLTGGEPLQQVDFLESWLPLVAPRHRFLLETNGVLPRAFERILPWIHTVSMDIKLPSSAKTGVYWKRHEEFLGLAKRCEECYVKIILTADTDSSELKQALEMVRSLAKDTLVILQPASQTSSFGRMPSYPQLTDFVEQARFIHPTIRVMPQVHKLLGVF